MKKIFQKILNLFRNDIQPSSTISYFEVLLLLNNTRKEIWLVEAQTEQEAKQIISDYFIASRMTHEIISLKPSLITTTLNKK
jgi:hypothetical protein